MLMMTLPDEIFAIKKEFFYFDAKATVLSGT
jgi:hypothetical protein